MGGGRVVVHRLMAREGGREREKRGGSHRLGGWVETDKINNE